MGSSREYASWTLQPLFFLSPGCCLAYLLSKCVICRHCVSRAEIFFAPHSRERNDPKWPAYVGGWGGARGEHPYFKGTKVQGEHTRIITHWDNMFEGEREREGGGCIDSWKLRRRWKSGAAAPAIALEDIFSLFFNLQLMRFSAAPLCSVVSVYPILSRQPHLLYLRGSPCRSRIGLFV